MKRQFSEKAFRDYLDSDNPKGIQRSSKWFKDAKEYQKKDYTNFHMEYNDWIEMHERENGYNSTGCYS